MPTPEEIAVIEEAAAQEGLPLEDAVPVEEALPVEEAPAGAPGGEIDVDSIMAELDQFGVPEAPGPSDPAANLQSMLTELRGSLGQPQEPQETDVVVQRIAELEQMLQKQQEQMEQQRQESLRTQINTSIDDAISDEVQGLKLKHDGAPARGYARILKNAVAVSVARAQTLSGRADVDAASIRTVVQKWSKILNQVAGEIAAQKAVETRQAVRGSQPTPFKPGKSVSKMNDDEFKAAKDRAWEAIYKKEA